MRLWRGQKTSWAATGKARVSVEQERKEWFTCEERRMKRGRSAHGTLKQCSRPSHRKYEELTIHSRDVSMQCKDGDI
jgi:hypothetical protein